MTWPSWAEVMIGAGLLGTAIKWIDDRIARRSALSRENRTLKQRIEEAKAEAAKANETYRTASEEWEKERQMLREDRERLEDRVEHLESMLFSREGRS